MIRTFALAVLALVAVGLSACNPPSWDPVQSGADVPSSYGPCGSWPDCGADQPKAERCCYPTTKCWTEADGSKSCVGSSDYDPSQPVTWGAKKMAKTGHFKRTDHGEAKP